MGGKSGSEENLRVIKLRNPVDIYYVRTLYKILEDDMRFVEYDTANDIGVDFSNEESLEYLINAKLRRYEE